MTKSRRTGKRARKGSGSSGGGGPSGAPEGRFTHWFVRLEPPVAIVATVAVYAIWRNSQLTAVLAFAALILWLPFVLSTVGSKIPPRDRTRAGAIDFGKRNNT